MGVIYFFIASNRVGPKPVSLKGRRHPSRISTVRCQYKRSAVCFAETFLMSTLLQRVLGAPEIASHVARFIPADTFAVLKCVSPAFQQKFSELEQGAKEDKRFVELRDYIVDDLVNKQGFEQSHDEYDYDDYSDESYYVMFVGNGVCLYLLRSDGHSITVSAESFGWEDFVVHTKDEWDVYSPLIAIPPLGDSTDDESAP